MAVEYEISSDVATITGVASNTQVANIVKFYTGSVTYDDEPTSKYASVTINGKTQRVMLCIAVSGTVTYDDVPCLYSTVSGHRCLNIVEPTGTEIIDDVPSLYETITVDGKNVRAIRCVLVNQTPVYDGVSSTCTFVDSGKTHTAQLVNVVSGGAIETIVSGVSPLSLPDAVAADIPSLIAFGGTEQRNLPDGYTQLEYIETDGNSYIDTNLLLSNTSEFEITFKSADATLNTPIMGAISGGTSFTSTDNLCVTYTVASGLNAYAVYCNGAAGDANESWNAGDARDKLKHTVKYNGLNIAPTLDGVDMEQLVPTTLTTNTPTVTTWLFGRNNTGSGTKAQTGVRIYDFKVVGIAHFIPCKNASNVVGMYDIVSGQFFTNAGTGDFTAGADVVPTPDAPMDIVSNNGVLKARHQSGLPLGYTLLDYIESTGTQYIDTGVAGGVDTLEIGSQFSFSSFVAYAGIFGNWIDDNHTSIRLILDNTDNGKGYAGFETKSTGTISNLTKQTIHNVVLRRSNVTIDETSTTLPAPETPTNTGNIALFNRSVTNLHEVRNIGLKVYSFYIKNNGVLVRDFVPAKNSSGVVGMYDTVNGVFYQNTGTGDFTAGDPVSDPVEVYADGLQETIAIKDDQSATVSTATCEDLLRFGATITDEQEVISGVITRKVGVIVFDGTENWVKASNYTNIFYTDAATDAYYNEDAAERIPVICTHLQGTDATNVNMTDNTIKLTAQGQALTTPLLYIKASVSGDSLTTWENWLATQYANGTPVMVVYPLKTATTESVTGQPMQTAAGDNVLEITQASLSNLELEAQYEVES